MAKCTSAPAACPERHRFTVRMVAMAFAHLGVLGLAYLVNSGTRAIGILRWASSAGPDPQRPVVLSHVIDVLLFPIGSASPSLIAEGRVLPMALGFGLIVLNSLLWGACLTLIWQKCLPRRVESA